MSQTPPESLREIGEEFRHAARFLTETVTAADTALAKRMQHLAVCISEARGRLAYHQEEIRTLPEQIGKWEAERARLLLRQALEAGRQEQPQPELYRAGLPPERLRKVWAEWEMVDGVVYVFRGNKYRCAYRPPTEWWDIGAEHTWRASYRPHGKTWAEVEAMADAAEKPAEPKMLDLRELPVGTVCEAIASLPIPRRDLAFAAGQRFTIDGFDASASALPVRALFDGIEWWLPALVPARVVKEGGEQ